MEAPHRLRQSLLDMLHTLGDRRVAVCRELTKAFEEVFRGTISQALAHFPEPRGEFTLVVEGAPPPGREVDQERLREELAYLRSQGMRAKEAVAQVVAQYGVPRRLAYRLWLQALKRRPVT
jgi:16S rRNA (cytidine1402-2'-O)-methyltransferase